MANTIYNIFGTGYETNTLLFGIEIEVEYAAHSWETLDWSAVNDGSLRNGGLEFISTPKPLSQTIDSIKLFFNNAEQNGFNEKSYEHFSERTSIHVHTNVGNLTIDELTSLLILYQVTEDLLFKFVGKERQNNIFCVPWSQTRLNYNLLQDIKYFIKQSTIDRNKYTALNLIPIKKFGSIEWRHMGGTSDIDKITIWLNIINRFFEIVKNNSLESISNRIRNLNTTSEYDQLLEWLFGNYAIDLYLPGYKLLLENGVLNYKYSIIGSSDKNNTIIKNPPNVSPFGEDEEFNEEEPEQEPTYEEIPF